MKDKNKAVLFMVLAAFLYAFMAAIVKSIEGIPLFETLLFRNIFGTLFIALIIIRQRILFKGVNKKGIFFRGITGFIAIAFYYLAITKTPLGETVTIANTYPFIVLILSAIFLREKIKRDHLIALGLSIIGILLIVRPGFADLNIGYLYAILTSVFTAITYTILKHLRQTDSAEVIVFYFSLIGTLLCIPFMAFGQFILPNAIQIVQLVGLGVAGTLYQWFISTAYKHAPAGEISIYSYSSVLFSSLMGILFWDEHLMLTTVIGMLAIIGGAFVIYNKDKQVAKN